MAKAKVGRPTKPKSRQAVRISTTVSPHVGAYLRLMTLKNESLSSMAKIVLEHAAAKNLKIV